MTMFGEVIIPITKDIYETCEPTIIVSRIWGLFPLSVHREGNKIMFKRSIILNIYNILIALTLARGLIRDAQAGEKSVRMKTPLATYVTVADVTIVAFTVFIGIVGSSLHVLRFKYFIKNLVEVDKIMPLSDSKKVRNISIAMLSVVLFSIILLLSMDFWTWIRFANHSKDGEYRVTNYLPFYLAYVIVILMEYQFWFIIYSLQRRMKVLRKLLTKENFQTGILLKNNEKLFGNDDTNFQEDYEHLSSKYLNEIVKKSTGKKTQPKLIHNNVHYLFDFKAEHLANLMTAFNKLSAAVECVNSFCGIFLLVNLLSCLTHLVVTPYFLVLEIYARHDSMYIIVQCFWIICHSCRIVGIVEPCHSFKKEEKKIFLAISKLLFFEDGGEKFKTQVNTFFKLIKATNNDFTACGLAKINRGLITTVVGAVTTYLVILIQFQKSSPQSS